MSCIDRAATALFMSQLKVHDKCKAFKNRKYTDTFECTNTTSGADYLTLM